MLTVGPDCPPQLQPLMKSVVDAIRDLQEPGKPVRMPFVFFAADLPPAASWPDCVIEVREKQCLAMSTLVSGVWTWLRTDGSAL